MPGGVQGTEAGTTNTNAVVQSVTVGFNSSFTGWLAVGTVDNIDAAITVLKVTNALTVTVPNLPLFATNLTRFYFWTWSMATNDVMTQYSKSTWSGNKCIYSFFAQSSTDLKTWTNVWSECYTDAPPGCAQFLRIGFDKQWRAMP